MKAQRQRRTRRTDHRGALRARRATTAIWRPPRPARNPGTPPRRQFRHRRWRRRRLFLRCPGSTSIETRHCYEACLRVARSTVVDTCHWGDEVTIASRRQSVCIPTTVSTHSKRRGRRARCRAASSSARARRRRPAKGGPATSSAARAEARVGGWNYRRDRTRPSAHRTLVTS